MTYGKIKKLPQSVIARIAAGEVVERPLNIVKELIENSIDAKSNKILVRIENGGLARILVQDDGIGISIEDLPLAFDLHTTSKLYDEQISNISTLGFRGEALASIATVARIESKSKTEDQNDGNSLIIEGGIIQDKKSISMNNGTSIEVSGIFFNTPVRRKFLKSPATERKRIIDLVTHFALFYPRLHFILEEIDNNRIKQRIESPSRQSLLAVIYDVLGHEVASELIKLKNKFGDWKISGYISKPNLTKSDRSSQYLCVNGRPIRHGTLQNIIESAYGSQLMRSAHPVIIIAIDGPMDSIDFNIHPQKREIRFRTEDNIFDEISHIIRNTLTETAELPILQESKIDRIPKNLREDHDETIEELVDDTILKKSKTGKSSKYIQQTLDGNPVILSKGRRVIGHIMLKFAVIEDTRNELWLVDVHAADERVKFEQFEKSSVRKVLSQQFLEPLTIEFIQTSEKSLLLDHCENLETFGLKISDAPGNKLFVHSCPIYFDQTIGPDTTKKLLDDIVSFLDDTDDDYYASQSPFDRIEYGIVARLACHGSIRSGIPVSNQVISRVVDDLLKCKNPWTCAHGRPTILRISKSKLEGWFRR